jgi:hypothetical protein
VARDGTDDVLVAQRQLKGRWFGGAFEAAIASSGRGGRWHGSIVTYSGSGSSLAHGVDEPGTEGRGGRLPLRAGFPLSC